MSFENRYVELSKGTPFVFGSFDRESGRVYFFDGEILCSCELRSFPPKSRGIKIAVDKAQAFKVEATIRHSGRYTYDNVIYRSCDE